METAKCLVELDEILKHLSKENLEKIPYEIRKKIHDEKDNNYIWNFDNTKPLSEQNINRKTIAILAYLNTEYLLSEEQKKFMKKIYRNNEQKLEQAKREKYNSENIFKKQNEVNLIEVKKEKWYKKIFMFIRKIFK